MAIGTSTTSTALKMRKTLPAKRTPRPSEIHVARAVKAPRGGTSLSQTNRNATPSTARTAEVVSTSAPSMSTTLISTSAQANEEAPSTAGPICAGVESLVTMRMRYGGTQILGASSIARNLVKAGSPPFEAIDPNA